MACCLALAGCNDQELYSNLSERASNRVVEVLLKAGMDVRKETSDGGKTWTTTVPREDLVRALEILRVHGEPERTYDNLGELFKKEGFVSTPSEEKVRFIYGISQELSETLSHIDGVILARVQIVLPDNDPLASTNQPASASVFIKYRSDANLEALTDQIRNLVAHSVEGLSYDHVSLTLVPADPMSVQARAKPADQGLPYFIAAAIALFLAGAGAIMLALRRRIGQWSATLGASVTRLRQRGFGPPAG